MACWTAAPPMVASQLAAPAQPLPAPDERCDYCGSAQLEWRKCKLVCLNCRQINKSCADL